MKKDCIFFTHGQESIFYAIELVKKSDSNIVVHTYKISENYQEFDCYEATNGDKVNCFVDKDDLIFSIDVWSKYYFPKFYNENDQWYHRIEETDTSYIDILCEAMKFSYNLAIKEIDIY